MTACRTATRAPSSKGIASRCHNPPTFPSARHPCMTTLPSSTDASSAGAQRVLLGDDKVDAVESMEILLQAFGFEVSTAVHPDLALAQLESFSPAAAVIDIG